MGIDANSPEATGFDITDLNELPEFVGKEFVTPWFSMDDDRSDKFEYSTYLDSYPNPYEEFEGEGYGEGLVEGFHLLGMIDFLLNHVIVPKARIIPWNYGLDSVRFVSVVRTSDKFRLVGRLTEAVERGGKGYLVTAELTAEVEGREKPAFVATQRALWAPLPDRDSNTTPDAAASPR
ncbi:hypothetical protein [Rhodococcoides kroppenstedtii]|uniref:hypothetical protein n=1 Tax=Rhodococcoides kroppenstedtii TaxID=293050 RepID=UPI0028E2D937|nr:hypothetical protein [Rhodococcus kroppenstedtii]